MTRFRLNAGRPAPYHGSRSPAFQDTDETIPKITTYPPNSGHDDAHLACGCTIPWPVIVEFGGHIHGQVLCSEHGYQPKITKTEITRIRKEARQWQHDSTQSTLDVPGF